MIYSHNYQGQQCYLKHVRTGQPVRPGQALEDFRGGKATLIGGRAPRHPGSTGKVYTEHGREFFPGVFACTWEPTE